MAVDKMLARAREAIGRRSPGYILRAGAKIAADWIRSRFWHFYYLVFKLRRMRKLKFVFCGLEYPYFYHSYNTTYRSERAVEIPLAVERLECNPGKRVLEVGNVLSHYVPVSHEVLDKYERADGIVNLLEGYRKEGAVIINEDVSEFNPAAPYDLIISVSTLEHVGWDEEPREPEKILRVLRKLTSLLAENGVLFVTMPLGHNKFLDSALADGRIEFGEAIWLKRVSKDNQWKQVTAEEVAGARYGHPFPSANAIIVGIIKRR